MIRDLADSTKAASRVIGDFRLERLIAEGGMAHIYDAHQISEDRRVALKLIAPEAAADSSYRERLMREARAAMDLDHPNVVPIYGAGEADGHLFIAMRLIEGEDLGKIIDAQRPLPVGRTLMLLRQIAAGLDAAHAAGLVHRDVKPSNVMVERPGQSSEHCYLVDFGLAVDQRDAPVMSAGGWAGTPAYVAPEHLRGELLDARTDVYALAVLAFRALAGEIPYAREHDSGTLLAHLYAPPPSLTELRPELPRAVDPVIARALAKAPDARHSSAGQLAGELEEALLGQAPDVCRPTPAERSRPRIGNLPAEIAFFAGRRIEIETMRDALAASRLLSVVGPGGVGKTTLALRLAASAEHDYSGAWVVELDSVRDAAGLELALPRVLGLRLAAPGPTRSALIEFIEQRRLLLVFDNCDHLIAEAGDLAGELLAACPRLTILATSREPLAVEGEHVYALGALELPDEEGDPTDVLASDSARLLLERAGEYGLSVELTPETVAAIARICVRLEGIPLALELAAARLRTLSVQDLEQRLQSDLRVLTPSAGEDRDRRQTLDGMIDSSWRLLGADERTVLARLAVFVAPFTLEAAEAVASVEDGDPIDAGPLVMALADKSLLQVDALSTRARFRMLQPVREFCWARLAPAQRASARAAHRAHYLARAERAAPMLDSAHSSQWLAVLDDDQQDIRAAIESALADGDPQDALRIAVAMRQFWACRGLAGEGIELLDAALRGAQSPPRALRAKAHSAIAHLAAGRLFDTRAAEPHAREALRLARSTGDADTIAEALIWLSWSESFAGRAAEGLAHAQEALTSASSIEDPTVLGRLLDAEAVALEHLGETSAARLAYERARGVFARAGYAPGVASVDNHLGDLDLSAGDLVSAAAHFSQAQTTAEAAGDGASVAMAALNLALIEHLQGRRETARELFVDALITNQACGDRANIAFSIFGLALTEPQPERAAELHGSAAHRLAQLDILLSALEQRMQTDELERLCDGLGTERFECAIDRGHLLTVDEVIAAVLDDAGDRFFA